MKRTTVSVLTRSGWMRNVSAYRVPIRRGFLYVHRGVVSDKGWSVTEPESGLAFITGVRTMKDAVKLVHEIGAVIRKYREKAKRAA